MSQADASQQRQNIDLWRQNLQALMKQCHDLLNNPLLGFSERVATLRVLLDAMIEQRKELGDS